jgi:hypothetical protein
MRLSLRCVSSKTDLVITSPSLAIDLSLSGSEASFGLGLGIGKLVIQNENGTELDPYEELAKAATRSLGVLRVLRGWGWHYNGLYSVIF